MNPFLGELFLGKWEDDAGTTHLVSEQVRYGLMSEKKAQVLTIKAIILR